MTLKKMSVAANDIVLNNLVMREKTFKTVARQRWLVLLKAHFSSTQLSPAPCCRLKPFHDNYVKCGLCRYGFILSKNPSVSLRFFL